MKNLLFIFCFSLLMLFSCSSDNEGLENDASILGLWKLVSVIENYDGSSTEAITDCQSEFNQMDFRENNQLFWTQTTDDPSVSINQCEPIIRDFTFVVSNNNMSLTNNSTNNSFTVIIDQLTSNTLRLVIFESNNIDNIVLTFNSVNVPTVDLIIGTWRPIKSGALLTNGTVGSELTSGCAVDDRFNYESNGNYFFVRYVNEEGSCVETDISQNFLNGSWEKISTGNYEISYSWEDIDTQQIETENNQPEDISFINGNLMRIRYNGSGVVDHYFDDFERVE